MRSMSFWKTSRAMLARTVNCPLPLFSAAAQLHLAAMAQGRLDEDPACVFAVLEQMTERP